MYTVPHFDKINGVSTLIVENKPFLMLGGEIHNSSASSKDYMEKNVWENVNAMNVNCVLAPVYWELIESDENHFNFDSVQSLIDQARRNKKKLILLWFGLWKNGISTYVPAWMKRNREDYFFVEKENGEKLYSISPVCRPAIEKDAHAFQRLMKFLKEYDSEKQTVIMVQIENEIGALSTDCDYNKKAKNIFEEKIPEELVTAGYPLETWEQCFREEAKEYFMAYHYAKAVDRIAELGKKEYTLPLFVNAWLEKYPSKPGEYPTGGPTARLAPFWKKIAKNIEAIAPDIYVPNFSDVCDQYSNFQDILLVPETRQDLNTISNLLYGIAKYNLNCFSPFGIEDFMKGNVEQDEDVLSTLSIDASAFNYVGTGELLSNAYKILNGMSEMIIQYRGTNKIFPFMKDKESDRGDRFTLNNCELKISFENFNKKKVKSSGFIIESGKHEFFIVGINININFYSKSGQKNQVGILDLEEGEFHQGIWRRGRLLNGDERYKIHIGNQVKVLRVSYHEF